MSRFLISNVPFELMDNEEEKYRCFEEVAWEKYRNFLHLQYSLHFTSDAERYEYLGTQVMKIIDAIKSLNDISKKLNDIYKVNYILLNRVNDSRKNVDELKKIILSTQKAVLKISKMCDINGCDLTPSESYEKFLCWARKEIENVEAFCSDGTDVNAGCGQFYNESII